MSRDVTPVSSASVSLGQLDSLSDAVGDAFLVVDHAQKLVVYNKAAESVFGYAKDEVVGRHMGMLLPDRFRSSHVGQVDGFSSNGRGHRISATGRNLVKGLRNDGLEFPAEVTISVLEVDGQLMASATVRDVTSRVETQRALNASEERFRVAFNLSPVAMALVDLEGRCMTANLALIEQTGFPMEQLAGMEMVDLILEEDRSLLVDALNTLLSGESPIARVELRQRRAGGSARMVDLSLGLVVDEEGAPIHMIGQSLDISERVEAQTRLEEMVRSRDELIASVSHELRTPLAAMVGFAHILRDEESALTTGERREMIEWIVAQSADLSNIVEDLLVAAKAHTDLLQVIHIPVNLRAQAIRLLETWPRLEFSDVEVAGPIVMGVGDPARIRQILRNLLSNALSYGGERLRIWTEHSDRSVRVGVGDNGEPIPDVDRARIFEPYQRAHHHPGLTSSIGFGLAISRQLARLMDGDLTLERIDGFNIFWLTLPVAED